MPAPGRRLAAAPRTAGQVGGGPACAAVPVTTTRWLSGKKEGRPESGRQPAPGLSLKSRVSARDSQGMEGGPQRSTWRIRARPQGREGLSSGHVTCLLPPPSRTPTLWQQELGGGLAPQPALPPQPPGRCPRTGWSHRLKETKPAIPPEMTSRPTQNPTSTPAPRSWGRGHQGSLGRRGRTEG